MFGPKMRRHIHWRQPALDIAGVPQSEQVIEQRGAQKSALAKLLHAGAAVALGQRCAVRAHQKSDMAITGAPQRQGIEQHQLPRSVGEMVVAAQNVRHPHHRVIDGVAKEERRRSILAPDDEIADVARRESLRSVHEVGEFDHRLGRHGEAQCRPQSARGPLGTLRRRQLSAGPRVARRLARHALQFSRQLQLLGGAKAGICAGLGLQAGEQLL